MLIIHAVIRLFNFVVYLTKRKLYKYDIYLVLGNDSIYSIEHYNQMYYFSSKISIFPTNFIHLYLVEIVCLWLTGASASSALKCFILPKQVHMLFFLHLFLINHYKTLESQLFPQRLLARL